MEYKLKITSGLNDSKRSVTPHDYLPNDYFPNGFIPRVGDTIVWKDLFWDVRSIVIDNAYSEIRIWVKDSEYFK
jgi:hypothetical protein